MNREQVAKFIQETEKMFQTGVTTEHSYRPIFQDFFKGLPVSAINDPQRSENGAPDFVFLDIKDNAKVLGYAEMKNLDENLDKIEKSEQMERYKGYKNIFLTNNFDWRFFRNGIKYQEIKIATFEKGRVIPLYGNYIELGQELIDFFNQPPEEVKSGKHLAEIMGGKARRIRDNIEDIAALEKDSDIISIYNMMKEMLVSDLTLDQFADILGIVIAGGLVVAYFRHLGHPAESGTEANFQDSKPGVIITISREHGSQGKKIGELVAKQLGIPYYYKELTALAAEESGINKEYIKKVNSNDGEEIMKELYLTTSPAKYAIEAQEQVLKEIAKKGACIIVGRAADYVLRDNPHVLRIFIHAPLDYRVHNIMNMYDDDEKSATKNIKRSDKNRADYYSLISGQKWGDLANYDLCINAAIGKEKAADLIANLAQAQQ